MDEFAAVRQTFFAESRDMLENIETALSAMQAGDRDAETLNGIFRAAHTVKGSAGLFGYARLVGFAHHIETLLDRLRARELDASPAMLETLQACNDHLARWLDVLEGEEDEDAVEARGRVLVQRLAQSSGELPVDSEGGASGTTASEQWAVRVVFHAELFRLGMDPLSFIHALAALAQVRDMHVLTEGMPLDESFDPETCYLGFSFSLEGNVTREAIVQVFDFVREECDLRIEAPAAYVQSRLEALAEEEPTAERLGEALVRHGLAAPQEVESALRHQAVTADGAPIGKVLAERSGVAPEAVEAVAEHQARARAQSGNETRFIRVRADKLDRLIDLVGELVIAGAGAQLIAGETGQEPLIAATQEVNDLVEGIRDEALSLRMVQIGETFGRFRRLVREIGEELGKRVRLEVIGAETELDKSLVERISDPLMHLVRNAMDHGLELPAERLSAGKPAEGLLRLNAFHDAGSIVIEVSDDGRGLDAQRIRAKAEERGLITEKDLLSDEQVHELIFHPGFSTAVAVTKLSGRGVGMDVVKRNVEEMRGTVTLRSRLGAGTTAVMRLPLTLAIIDGFRASCGEANFVLPLDAVVECIAMPGDCTGERGYINLRGRALPYVRLRSLFEMTGHAQGEQNVIVLRSGGEEAGVVVDRLHGEFQTVIKPLGRLFEAVEGISGSTILGNGDVALIVDVPAVVKRAASTDGKPEGRRVH